MPYGDGVKTEFPGQYEDWTIDQFKRVPVENWTESMVIECNCLIFTSSPDDVHESGFPYDDDCKWKSVDLWSETIKIAPSENDAF